MSGRRDDMTTTTTTLPAEPVSAPAEGDRGVRARTLVLGVLVPALAAIVWTLLKSTVVLPWFEGVHGWMFSRDLFVPLPAARYVSQGAVFQMYEPAAGYSSIGYPYTPALPFLFAPGRVDRSTTSRSPTTSSTRSRGPGLFVIFGPVAVVIGIVPLMVSIGAALRTRLSAAKTLAAQWAVLVATASVTLVYIHPEDAIVCASLIGSAHVASKGNWRRAGVLVAVAILFKQWAVIPSLVLLAAAPWEHRRIYSFYSYLIPLLVMAPFLLATPEATFDAMTGAQATLTLGHQQLWTSMVFGSTELASATLLRLLWMAAAAGIVWHVRNRTSLVALLGGLGAVMLARVVCEPTIFAYYLGPAFVSRSCAPPCCGCRSGCACSARWPSSCGAGFTTCRKHCGGRSRCRHGVCVRSSHHCSAPRSRSRSSAATGGTHTGLSGKGNAPWKEHDDIGRRRDSHSSSS